MEEEMITKQHEEEDDYVEEEDNSNLKQLASWGTWEELLLTCAVKRHGFKNWDSVATEVRSRTSISDSSFVSANNCKQKYIDLKQKYQKNDDDATEKENIIPWLEELRSLRVQELRREVERYDVSILSLQLKVKKLEEEREKPDLEEEEEEEERKTDSESKHREKAAAAEAEAEEEDDDRENRSMNESNSTGSGEKTVEREHTNRDPEAEEEGFKTSDADELGESGTSERKWKRKRKESEENCGGDGGEIRSERSESEPLISLLDLIRSHPRGSLFERRLRSQENKEYKSMVKQHLDIETIQKKLKKGAYDSSSLSFYRDLQLVFTNAIVFFPSSSSESMAAYELRKVVYEEMRKKSGKSGPRLIKGEASGLNSVKADAEVSDSSLSRQRSSGPLVVCKRKSFGSAKASPSSSSFSQKEESKEVMLSEEKEATVAGARSSRRSTKGVATKTGKGKSKQKQTESKTVSPNDNDSSKQETGKTEKKNVSSDKKKSVADFLKRLKKNSPQKESKDQNKSGKKESKSKPRELRSSSVGKKKAEVENTPVKRALGRPQKKTAEAVATTSVSGKRGRETGSTGKDNKQPKKRTRR